MPNYCRLPLAMLPGIFFYQVKQVIHVLHFVIVSIPDLLLGDSLATTASGGAAAAVQAPVRVLKSEKVFTADSGPAPAWPVRNNNDNKNRTGMCQERILVVHSSCSACTKTIINIVYQRCAR